MFEDAPTKMTIERGDRASKNPHIVLVNFLNTISGEQREYEHDASYPEYDGVFQDFIWSEGNYSCDCNRALFFFGYDPDWDCNVGENKILIESIIDKETGTELWSGDARHTKFFQPVKE